MGTGTKSRVWRACRICFRWVRITVWLLILLGLSGLIYLNQVGLPNLVKKPLLEKLRERGLDLQFSRLRVRWYQGIVAENVRFGRADQQEGPQLSVDEVRIGIDSKALKRFEIQVDSITLLRGKLLWPITENTNSQRALSLDHIEAELRFLPGDQWALDNFKAAFAGASIRLSGLLTNASAVREWKFLQEQPPGPGAEGLWQNHLARLADTVSRIRFGAHPYLWLSIRGDARELQSFGALLLISAPAADTPWGAVSHGRLTGRVFPATSNELSRAELQLQAADAQSRWANLTNFSLRMRLSSADRNANFVNGRIEMSAKQAQTPWCTASNASFNAQWVDSITNPIPVSGQASFRCERAQTQWGGATQLELNACLVNPSNDTPRASADSNWGWWSNLQPYSVSWEGQVADLHSPQIQVDRIACSGTWLAPQLAITNVTANLYNGELKAQGVLDVATRELRIGLTSDFDLHKLAPLLPGAGRQWLEQFSWTNAPQLSGNLSLVLPIWTNQRADWRTEVQPTLKLQGEFSLPNQGAYRQVEVSSAHSHFIYSNCCWYLPDLTLRRPEGSFQAVYQADDRTLSFSGQIRSSVDPRILLPLLNESQRRVFDLFTLTEPPLLEGEISGRFHEPQRTSFSGRVALTNFTFRGESITAVRTALQYTNQLLQFFSPQIQCGTQQTSADGLLADFSRQLVFLTNGFSTVDPGVIARAIGPPIWRAIEPYQFLKPPTARVHGTIPMHGEADADLHFDLDGGPFHWWKFNLPHISGHVHWSGLHLTLSELRSDFYDGSSAGSAAFDFTQPHTTSFEFNAAVTNVLLQQLMADLVSRTNRLEGRLNGRLVVTKANTDSLQSVSGFGEVHLRDGLIWDIPLFGIFTPVLNGISPGLGNSRANSGTSSFIITTGVLRSNDLEIRSSAMRLLYHGTVDFEGKLNARVEAELLRDVWLVGPLVSTLFWPLTKMFEYKVTGTLAEPKSEPVFLVPRLMTLPFLPFRSLKGVVPEDQTPHPSFSPVPP